MMHDHAAGHPSPPGVAAAGYLLDRISPRIWQGEASGVRTEPKGSPPSVNQLHDHAKRP